MAVFDQFDWPRAMVADEWLPAERERVLRAGLALSAADSVFPAPLRDLIVAYARPDPWLVVLDTHGLYRVRASRCAAKPRLLAGIGDIPPKHNGAVSAADGSFVMCSKRAVYRISRERLRVGEPLHLSLDAARVAGEEVGGGFANGPVSTARFECPLVSGAGGCDGSEVLIADLLNHRLRRIGLATQRVNTLCGSGAGEHSDGPALTSGLRFPRAAIADPLHPPGSAARPDLLILSADRLRRFSFADGGQLSTVPVTTAGFVLSALAPTPSGWVVVACSATAPLWAIHPVTGQSVQLTNPQCTGGGGGGDETALRILFPQAVVVLRGVRPDTAATQFLTLTPEAEAVDAQTAAAAPTAAGDGGDANANANAKAKAVATADGRSTAHAFVLDRGIGVWCLPLPAFLTRPHAHTER